MGGLGAPDGLNLRSNLDILDGLKVLDVSD